MRAGIAAGNITPGLGTRTELFQNLQADKIVTPLLVKVCIMELQDTKVALVTGDVMDFFADSIRDIRNIVFEETGIKPENIYLNSSHTHSAPYIYPSAQKHISAWNTGFLDMDYYRGLLEVVRSTAKSALAGLADVTLKHSKALVEGVASCRRVELEDGTIGVRYGRNVPEELVAYPDGLIDPYAECVWLEGADGKLAGVLVNYACHGTSYNQYSEICWDYMGFAREFIEKELGGQALFLQGCAGNISPGKYTVHEPLEDAVLLGSRLASAVIGSRSSAKQVESDKLVNINEKILLQGRTTLSACQLEQKLEDEIAKTLKEQEENPGVPKGAMVISYAERLLMSKNYPGLCIPSEIGLLKVGDISMVFLPGECFIQYALKIKEHMAGKPVLVMAYTDCTLQYIPDKKAYEDRGGYETDPDWCYSAIGNGEKLVEKALEMLSRA